MIFLLLHLLYFPLRPFTITPKKKKKFMKLICSLFDLTLWCFKFHLWDLINQPNYLVSEYAYTLKVDEKSDVYSFGVVLLELVTGRRPVGEFGDGVDIVQWVRKMTDSNKEGVLKVLDPRLPSVPLHEVMHVFYVAMLCVEEQAIERPTMLEVVQILTELPKQPSSKQGDSTITDSSSATIDLPNVTTKDPKDHQHPPPPQSPPPDLLSI